MEDWMVLCQALYLAIGMWGSGERHAPVSKNTGMRNVVSTVASLGKLACREEDSEVFFSTKEEQIRDVERMSAMRESLFEDWNVHIANLAFLRGETGGGVRIRSFARIFGYGGRAVGTTRNASVFLYWKASFSVLSVGFQRFACVPVG